MKEFLLINGDVHNVGISIIIFGILYQTKCQAVIDLSDESIQVHKFTSSIY